MAADLSQVPPSFDGIYGNKGDTYEEDPSLASASQNYVTSFPGWPKAYFAGILPPVQTTPIYRPDSHPGYDYRRMPAVQANSPYPQTEFVPTSPEPMYVTCMPWTAYPYGVPVALPPVFRQPYNSQATEEKNEVADEAQPAEGSPAHGSFADDDSFSQGVDPILPQQPPSFEDFSILAVPTPYRQSSAPNKKSMSQFLRRGSRGSRRSSNTGSQSSSHASHSSFTFRNKNG